MIVIDYICGDGRYLPFEDNLFDAVFSYSVIQHLSKDNASKTLFEVRRTLKHGGISFIQMPNKFGIRSFQHQMKRKFREPINFEVRYWSPNELKKRFSQIIGKSSISIDGFFGLGIQKGDAKLLPLKAKTIIYASEGLRKISSLVKPLKFLADSLYVKSIKS